MSGSEAGPAMRLNDWVQQHAQKETGEAWQLESSKMLEVHQNNESVFTKHGAMVAYYGDLRFERAGTGGAGKFVKRAMTGESGAMTHVTGHGILYCADQGKQISIVYLDSQTIFVNGSDCLAYSPSLDWDIVMTKGANIMAGGLFSLRLSGTGYVAITTHGKPMVLGVSDQSPLSTDPNATVAWSDGLTTNVKTDVNLKTITGRASGETLQMNFSGQGFVVVQPFEEVTQTTGG
jgi:uncharacterized protein (AIM24 family)